MYEKHPDLETGHPRVAFALFEERGYPPELIDAVDELSGFIAAVSRDDMRLGAEEIGEDFDAHLAFVIAALEPRAEELGLTGEAGVSGGAAAEA
jgi:hypothetical protein